jgi:hydroxymethylpyrimidine/phosphomethylpyrimidine kinase
MSKYPTTQPTALTIAGSDSGGGAGIQADLKTFAALGVHGTSALTCVTAQNPRRVLGLQPCRPEVVRSQIEAVLAELPPAAVKTGMLYSAGIIRVLVELFGTKRRFPLIVDPVMVATSGTRLLKPAAIGILRSELLPQATLVTPNRDEAQILAGLRIASPEDMRMAARAIHSRFGCAALVKGGHLDGMEEAIDIFYDGRTELLLSAPFVKGIATHGTGCAYSAAIAGYVALGCDLVHAVQMAKEYVTQAIAQSVRVAGYNVLNHFWKFD